MSWIEDRLFALEQRVEYIARYLENILDQLRNASQNARNAFAQPQTGGSSTGGVFYCYPTALSGAPALGRHWYRTARA